jgi:hypothetical protein
MATVGATMECPGCGARLKIEPRLPADRRVMCPHCGVVSKAPRRLIPDSEEARRNPRTYAILAIIAAIALFAVWLRWR